MLRVLHGLDREEARTLPSGMEYGYDYDNSKHSHLVGSSMPDTYPTATEQKDYGTEGSVRMGARGFL